MSVYDTFDHSVYPLQRDPASCCEAVLEQFAAHEFTGSSRILSYMVSRHLVEAPAATAYASVLRDAMLVGHRVSRPGFCTLGED